MSSPLGKKVEPVKPTAVPKGLKHLHGHIYEDEHGRWHNLACANCKNTGRICYICGHGVKQLDIDLSW